MVVAGYPHVNFFALRLSGKAAVAAIESNTFTTFSFDVMVVAADQDEGEEDKSDILRALDVAHPPHSYAIHRRVDGNYWVVNTEWAVLKGVEFSVIDF